jgi:HSP20 family protein
VSGLKTVERPTTLLPRADWPTAWLPDEFAGLFRRLLGAGPEMESREWPFHSAFTVEEGDRETVLRAELPGFAPGEIAVEVRGDVLTVEAEHKEGEGKEAGRSYAHVKRAVALPSAVEPAGIEAAYRHGVLEVHLPHKAEAIGRRIEVKG